ncbi:MAG: OmpP1/FadL family transporter [Desulfurivibrionaceae bacterium]
MRKKIVCLTVTGLLAAGQAWGSGFRITEQSINSVGMAGGYIANARGPDASYFNPANMAWNKDRWQIETSLNYINIPGFDYVDYRDQTLNGSSEKKEFLLPLVHITSKDINNFRFGFSLTRPFGLSKKWDEPFPAQWARKFSLEAYEGNPSMAYRVNDSLSLAVGVRLIYAKGEMKNRIADDSVLTVRDMEGDTTEWGYNLALSYQPREAWNISATYRSRVDLDLEGDADLSASSATGIIDSYDGDGEVEIVTPAVLTLSTSYTLKKATVTLTWDRTLWSDYEQLDFDYDRAFSDNPYFSSFDAPANKNWENTDAFRLAFSYKNTDRLTTMMGIALDETPVPEENLNFELPGSDTVLYSIGFRYQTSDNMEIGFAYLYNDREDRKVDNNRINGKFDQRGAHTVNTALIYTF